MDFSLTEDQRNIREAVLKHCSQFSDEYWLELDRRGEFPFEFHKSMAEAGWLGVAMPESVGGAGLGITEAAIVMQAVSEAGGGMTAAGGGRQPAGDKAATLFDKGEECGVEANAGKYLAAEAGFEACHTAMLTLGGMGYAQEYHVERYLREVLIPRTAPVSPHMILNFLAEKVLDLPKSY